MTAERSRFYALRVTVLLLGLLFTCGWAVRQWRTRGFRTDWKRSVVVEVVLAAPRPLPEATAQAWQEGLGALERWLASEALRYRPSAVPPVTFTLRGPVVGPLPSLELPERAVDRLLASFRLTRALEQLGAGLPKARSDARIYVLLEDSPTPELFVEGVGARGGTVGAIRAHALDDELTLSLTAVAHELFHCLGALDKYDPGGHARTPEGLAEPDRSPPLPQRFAEVMVGEVPLGPAQGRLPTSLSEVRVGPVTARELRWTP